MIEFFPIVSKVGELEVFEDVFQNRYDANDARSDFRAKGVDVEIGWMPSLWSERDNLLSMVSDIGKSALGFRPRFHGQETNEELRASIAYYSAMVVEDIERARAARIERKCMERRAEIELARARENAMRREEWNISPAFALAGL